MLAGSRLYATPIRVPRSFYINSSLPPTDPLTEPVRPAVTRTLPHGHQPEHVYKVCTADGNHL